MAGLQPPGTMTAAMKRASSPANSTCSNSGAPMKCCCGSSECVLLKHNYTVLDGVERDVHTAARMGQALLARHEAYMADAERDRSELTSRIDQLGEDNKELEVKNAKTVEENRELLDQLEAMNNAVADSEGHIKSLEASLLSSQQMIRRLESDTQRATQLERQLALLEEEQADLQNHLSLSREEARSAMSRWKRAERGIVDLQEQLERMEYEASEEREHHVEMIARFEKQRAMEKELHTAAGRLKGAAAIKSFGVQHSGNNAVSHFVRDLLQDNAYLQHGIAELKEMLLVSNDEIQALRDQLAFHQPIPEEDADEEVSPARAPTLMAELENKEESRQPPSPKYSQELHIHHHYHVQKQEVKKPRRKRQGLTQGIFVPPTGSAMSTPPNGPARHSLPPNSRESRWSVYSEQPSDFAPSSVPSSPRSNHRSSSLFEPMGDSFPGSPTTSVDPMSPTWRASHRKQTSSMSSRSFRVPTHFALTPSTPSAAEPILEEATDGEYLPDLTPNTDDSAAGDDELSSRDPDASNDDVSILVEDAEDGYRRSTRLRRAMSQESIMSLSGGLDIHTLKARPSQLTLRHRIPSSTTSTASSIVTAQPMLTREGSQRRSSAMLRDNYVSSSASSLRSVSNPVAIRPPPSSSSSSSTLGKLTGWRPWGGGGGTSGGNTSRDKDSAKELSRSPGINQAGAIPGFTEFLAAAQRKPIPTIISPETVDRDALRDGLGG